MLDRAVALAHRPAQVLDGHVALEIDKHAGAACLTRRHHPDRARRRFLGLVNLGRRLGGTIEARFLGRGKPRPGAFGQALGQGEGAVGSAGRAFGLGRGVGNEDRPFVVETQPAPGLGEKMHRRVPAARHQHHVTGQIARRAGNAGGVVVQGHDAYPLDAMAPVGGDDGVAGKHRDAGVQGPVWQCAGHFGTQIDDRLDRGAGGHHVEGGAVGVVVASKDHGAVAGLDPITVEIGARRPGQHDSRAVVIGEDQGPFDGAGGQHDLLGAHLP